MPTLKEKLTLQLFGEIQHKNHVYYKWFSSVYMKHFLVSKSVHVKKEKKIQDRFFQIVHYLEHFLEPYHTS